MVKEKEKGEKTYWQCEKKQICRARMHILGAVDGVQVRVRSEYTHPPEVTKGEQLKVHNEIKVQASKTSEHMQILVSNG